MNFLAKIRIFFFFFYFFLQEDFVINSQILVSERLLPFSTGLPSRSQAILLSLAFFWTFKMCSCYALNKLLKSHSHLCPGFLPCLKKHKENKTCSTFWLSKTRVAFPLNFLRDETQPREFRLIKCSIFLNKMFRHLVSETYSSCKTTSCLSSTLVICSGNLQLCSVGGPNRSFSFSPSLILTQMVLFLFI